MTKKYELTSETIIHFGRKLYRIRALMSFDSVSKGDLGGFVEREENLSQVSGNAWVYGDAQVSGDAWVTPIHIIGFPYAITITDDRLNIGCKSKTIADWKAIKEKAFKDDGYGYHWAVFKKMRAYVLPIAEYHHKRVKELKAAEAKRAAE